MPADNFSSVTIITNDSGMADAYSTAVFNMPLAEGMEFVNQLDGVEHGNVDSGRRKHSVFGWI